MFLPGERVMGWRRVAGAMWHSPDDPQIFGALDIDATALLAFIEQERARGATIDHRYADGWHISRAMAAFREYLADPQRFEQARDMLHDEA